ncbi:flagellar basal body-associated FliL family protein [Superficieibacter sp.]|uniref:flagellar basal body-associated FliL family protein n=1 Tax=Superficieibacter sp. TaxID=2303322 RepID=UPI0028AE63AF|nr:flagellar basal body-associated FliL family protein [Superficieibacter sp.]
MKKIILAGIFSAVTAAIVGGGVAWGVIHYMQNSSSVAASNTESRPQVEEVKVKDGSKSLFVSLPESVVTLHDDENDNHYMLVELAMVADDEQNSKRILADEPLYQSIVVSTLSEMKYENVRTLKISDIKEILLNTMNKEVQARGIPIPWSDILVKKVVFQ